MSNPYEPLNVDTIGEKLGHLEILKEKVGPDATHWSAQEVGDGNLNLVFIVTGPNGQAIVKQALPYVRLVGDSWPLPLKRAFFEYHALIRQAKNAPEDVPEVYHFDESQALIVMQFMTPHVILRNSLRDGIKHDNLAEVMGKFCARTLFRGSDLSMDTKERKKDLALFADNIELCDITENLVFTDPYFDAEMNRHTSPQLDGIVASLRADIDMKVAAQHFKAKFCNNAETLLHGDLHTGSIMVTESDTVVIDPEFATYGPFGFDIGMLLGNFYMAFFAQDGHEASKGVRDDYAQWILDVTCDIWHHFEEEFSHLWRTERTGILYDKRLYEDQGQNLASEQALTDRLNQIWSDALGFGGIEMHRRILGLAHIMELDSIEDADLRAACEARALQFGRQIVISRDAYKSPHQIAELARAVRKDNFL
ncbi:S-methyl-5-thioribose kinase [Maritalea mediterranea]|uniref:S-methyl-5-thioribose kinase n=1 Tax=Maritalea mediterranea TaxID=2909667 RepID=A0ABS9E5U1_9HYPH|nr:S-methyl-5-thioribose kinase [Maritalea mediterranea]